MSHDRPEPEDDVDRERFALIDRYGWVVVQIGEDDEGAGFSYSAGIHEKTGGPELLIVGLKPELAHSVINDYGHRLEAGERFEPGFRYPGLIASFKASSFIEATDPAALADYVCWTDWFYRRQPFPLLQLVYPSTADGAFPWQRPAGDWFRSYQRLLGRPPALAR